MDYPNEDGLDKAIGESIRISELLLEQKNEGFTEIVLTNPSTGETRTINLNTSHG